LILPFKTKVGWAVKPSKKAQDAGLYSPAYAYRWRSDTAFGNDDA